MSRFTVLKRPEQGESDAPVRSERRLHSIIATQIDLMASGTDLEGTLQLVTSRAQRLTRASGAVVELREGDEMIYRAATGSTAAHLGLRLPLARSLSGECLASGRVLLCEDSETDPRVNLEACRRVGARSMVLTPLRHEGSLVGVLKVISERPCAFTSDDEDTLQLLAGLIAAAIARAAEQEIRQRLIAEREAAAAALEERNAVLRSLFAASPLAVALVEREGIDLRYVSVNPALARMLGREVAEVEGRLSTEVGISEGLLREIQPALDEAERTGQPVRFDYARGEGEQRRWMSSSACLVSANGGRTRFAIQAEDLTEKVRLQQRLDLADRMATVGRLAAGVAHEANNPLAYVASNLNFALEELDEQLGAGPPEWFAEVKRSLTEAYEGAQRVKAIVRDLHTFSRSSTREWKTVDLKTTVERALAMASYVLKGRVQVSFEHGAPPAVNGSDARLGQVILNLVVNAAQAMPEGRDEAQNQIRIRTQPAPDGRVLIEVRDNGGGIPAEVLPRIFDPFFTTKKVGEGTGLGLSICHTIIADHGGEIGVESKAGLGTVFRILLPCAVAKA